MALFQRLNDDGLTILLVTHEPDVAEHARRIVTFKDGLILSDVPVARRRVAAEEVCA
jgi:putative ABC transport system ATP-binding protein